MTIDGYLNQIRLAKKKSEYLYQKANVLNDRLENANSSIYAGDSVAKRSSSKGKREELLVEWSDTIKASREASRTFF